MKKKYLVLALIILILPVAGLAAQEESSGDSFSILSFDIGYGPTYNLRSNNANNIGTLTTFGINVRVAGPLIIGFVAGSYNMLKVKFDVTSSVRAVIGYGGNTSTSYVGLGFEVVPFKREVGGLYTEFKLAPEYIFSGTDIGDGAICFGLILGIGF